MSFVSAAALSLAPVLVAIHIAGATALWVSVLRFRLGLVSPTETAAATHPPVPTGAAVSYRA